MIRTLTRPVLVLAIAAALPFAALARNDEADTKKQAAAPEMSAEQKAMMDAYQKAGTPGAPHKHLAKMEGTYDLEISSWDAPGAPPNKETGVATRKMMLGGRVMAEHTEAKMHGQPFTGHGMHGYDNVTGKHWSTWNDSMSTGLMVSEGECDDKGTCKFTGSWNDPVSKGKLVAKMSTRWTDANTEVFEMWAPGPDGKEFKMMEITYKKRAN